MKLKILFAFILALVCCSQIQAQSTDCAKVHDGKFEITGPMSGTTIIKRKGNRQIETNKDIKAKVVYEVQWLDECTYTLRPIETKRDKNDINFSPDKLLTVKILNVTQQTYRVSISSNFSDQVVEAELNRL